MSGPLQSGVGGVAAKEKLHQMLFCIFEARRAKWRSALAQALTISILRDERKKCLVVFFRCVDKDLELTEGMLGLSRKYSSTALGSLVVPARDSSICESPGQGVFRHRDHRMLSFSSNIETCMLTSRECYER